MNFIKRFAVWFLTKYYGPEVDNMNVSVDSVEISLKGYIKDDNNWHHLATNVMLWVKANEDTDLISEVSVYKNSVLEDKFKISHWDD